MKPTRAKLFQNGGSQAVRLSKECRFVAQREVLLRREGRRVILEPVDFDTLLAAHALSLGLAVVTNITRHFSRVPGLTVLNWV